MSRFIRVGGQTDSSGVDLSTCAINTSCSITASNFCGSGKTLCNNRWDLICCVNGTESGLTSGCIGSSLRIDFPTHLYDEFEFSISGFCFSCSYGVLQFSNCCCACTTANIGFCACCSTIDSSGVVGFCAIGRCCQCLRVVGDDLTLCNNAAFKLSLSKTVPDNGINFYYRKDCNSSCNLCYCYQECVGRVCGCCTSLGLSWNCDCACNCRFTSIILCSVGYCIAYTPQFNWSLYGRKNNFTTYSNAG